MTSTVQSRKPGGEWQTRTAYVNGNKLVSRGCIMKTIDLELAPQKGRKLAEFLDGLAYVPSSAPGLQSYHAAQAIKAARLRVGVERQCTAVKKAVRQFNVTVSITTRPGRPGHAVRLYSPIKQMEILL